MAETITVSQLEQLFGQLRSEFQEQVGSLSRSLSRLQDQVEKISPPPTPGNVRSELDKISSAVNLKRGSSVGFEGESKDDLAPWEIDDSSAERNFLDTIRRNRQARNSLFPERIRDERENKASQPVASVVVTAFTVDEKDKITTLTAKSFQYLNKKYKRYLVESPDTRLKMVSFLSTQVQLALVHDQSSKETDISELLDVSSIQDISDEVLYSIIAEYLRPKDREEFRTNLWEAVTDLREELKALARKRGEPAYVDFDLPRYETYMFPLVSRILDEIDSVDRLFRHKATAESLRLLPDPGYGSKSFPKAVNFYLHCFAPFAEHFSTYLGEAAMKAMKSTLEFTSAMRKVNQLFAKRSREHRQTLALVTPLKPLTELREQHDQRIEAKRLRFATAPAKLHALTEVDDHDNAVFESRLAKSGSTPVKPDEKGEYVKSMPLDFERDDDESAEIAWIDAEIKAASSPELFISQSRPSYSSQTTAPYRRPQEYAKDKPKATEKPCYSYAIKRECKDRECKFSHDEKVCREFILNRAADLLASPFYPVNTHSRELQSATQRRPAIVSRVEATGSLAATAEDSGFYIPLA
jgi:hypothetical protein